MVNSRAARTVRAGDRKHIVSFNQSRDRTLPLGSRGIDHRTRRRAADRNGGTRFHRSPDGLGSNIGRRDHWIDGEENPGGLIGFIFLKIRFPITISIGIQGI